MKIIIKIFLLFLVVTTVSFAQGKREIQTMVNNQEWNQALEAIPNALKNNPNDAELHSLAGDIYLEMQMYNDAYEVLDKANRMNRRNPEIMRKLAIAMSYTNKTNNAIELLQDAINRDEKNVKLRLTLGDIYIRADSLRRAETIITQAKDLDSKNPASFIALGDLYFAQKVYALAQQNYEEALKLNPELSEARGKLATSYYWLGQRERDNELRSELFKRSIDTWEQLVAKEPNNANALFELGRIYHLASQHQNTARVLDKYINLRPASSLARWYLAQALYELGSCEDARTHLEIVAKEIDSVSTNALLLLARCYYDTKEFAKAIETFSSIKTQTKLETRDMQFFGQAYFQTGDTLNAISIWKETIIENPIEVCRLIDQVGFLLNQRKEYRDAIDVLKLRVENKECEDGREHIVNYLIGSSYLFIEMPDSAIHFLSESIKYDSTFFLSQVSLADAYASKEESELAANLFSSIIEKAKSDPEKNNFVLIQAFSKLSGLELEQQNFNNVIRISREWSEVFPENPFAYLYLAIAYHNLGDGSQACKAYRKVLEYDKNNDTAKKNLKSLQEAGLCN